MLHKYAHIYILFYKLLLHKLLDFEETISVGIDIRIPSRSLKYGLSELLIHKCSTLWSASLRCLHSIPWFLGAYSTTTLPVVTATIIWSLARAWQLKDLMT